MTDPAHRATKTGDTKARATETASDAHDAKGTGEARAAEARFVRGLGFWGAYALICGSMIGTGIFLFVSPVAALAGSPAAILVVWVAGATIAGCGALSIAELAGSFPYTGGTYVYLREAYGAAVGFLYVWVEFLIVRVGNIAIFALAFASFLADSLRLDDAASARMHLPIALAAIAGVGALNTRGVRAGGRAQIALTACKLASLATVLAVGAAYAAGAIEPHAGSTVAASASVAGTHVPPAGGGVMAQLGAWSIALARLGAALIPVMWTFGGWDEATFVAEEVREPQRNVPRAVLAGVVSVGVLYVLTNAAYIAVLGSGGLAASGTRTAPMFLEHSLGPGAERALDVALMLSVLGTLNAVVLSGARLGFAAARDNAALRWLAHLHPERGTPARTLGLECVLAAIAAVALADPFALLLYSAVAYWGFAGLMAAAVIVLRRKMPDRPRPFRTPFYPWPSVVFACAAGGMLASAAHERPANAAITAILLAAGLAVFAVQRRIVDRV